MATEEFIVDSESPWDVPEPGHDSIRPGDMVVGIVKDGFYSCGSVADVLVNSFSYLAYPLKRDEGTIPTKIDVPYFELLRSNTPVIFIRENENIGSVGDKSKLELVAATDNFLSILNVMDEFMAEQSAKYVNSRIR